MEKIILHVDMDSFFASVAQQANPELRQRPIGVSGKEGTRTVMVAASKEAKKFGVKTAMTIFEAKKLCPSIMLVEPDPDAYWEVHERFVNIFNRFTDKVEVYSIDEAFLDFSGYVFNFLAAEEKAREIKSLMCKEIGEIVTCSVGIANNKFLAKVASDCRKPNGIFIIDENNKFEILDSCKLNDLWGIGRRLKSRLDDFGIETVRKLREQELDFLVAEFGNCGGHKLYDMCRGIDDSSVVAERYAPEARSVSRAYTMSEDTFDKKKIKQLLLTLAEKCGRALREKHLAGRTIEIFFRFEDFTHAGCRVTVKNAINDGLRIYNFGERILQKYRLPKAVRLVGVRISNLLPVSGQTSLWLTERKRALLLPYLDQINDQYGEFTIKSGLIADAQPLRRKVGGFKSKDT